MRNAVPASTSGRARSSEGSIRLFPEPSIKFDALAEITKSYSRGEPCVSCRRDSVFGCKEARGADLVACRIGCIANTPMIDDQYVWIVWASAFLVPWAVMWIVYPAHRRAMLWAIIFTAPFGLTEPLFVPECWNPPSLFSLAQRTGFDIESLVFCFGIGGVGAVLYSVLTASKLEPIAEHERRLPLHRHHYKALAAPFIVFPFLYFLPMNPIYAGIAAMAVGTVTTILCRPDLKTKTWVGVSYS